MSEVFRIAENIFVLRKRLSGAGAPVNADLSLEAEASGPRLLGPRGGATPTLRFFAGRTGQL